MNIKRFAGLIVISFILTWVLSYNAQADLDCGTPPGAPIEWTKDFPKPVPTPSGKVPLITGGYKKQKDDNKKPKNGKHGHETEVLEDPVKPPRMDFSVQNLYSYFDIKTTDIMTHLQVSIPKVKRFPKEVGKETETGPVVTGKNVPKRSPGAASWIIEWNYQPEYPAELVWDGVTCAIRLIMHPEIISYPEIKAHLIEVGVPAGIGTGAIPRPPAAPRQPGANPGGANPGGKNPNPVPGRPNQPGQKPANNGGAFGLMGEIESIVGQLPSNPPSIPSVSPRTNMNSMFVKLAAVEFTGGYPLMMDPNYAHRILSLGKDGLPAVIGCAKSSHIFLKRNAVAALANYHEEDAYKELRKYIKNSDLVVQLRAMKGLMNTKSDSNIKFFKSMLVNKDPMYKSIACYALGSYGDKGTCGKLMAYFNAALKANDKDFMWSLLPAIARCADADSSNRDTWINILRSAAKRFKSAFPSRSSADAGGEVPSPQDPKNPNVIILGQRAAFPEKVGYKNVILWEMTQLALAALNSEVEVNKILSMLQSSGIGQAFNRVNWFLVPDALGRIPGNKGVEALKSIALDAAIPESISVWAVRALEKLEIESKWFYEIVIGYGRSTVRAQALVTLSQKSGTLAKDACQKAIESFSAAPTNGAEAFFYTAVLQIGGQLSAFKSDKLLEVTRACFSARAYAKRQGNNDADITKSNISVYPPLLETAILELGRTGDAKAIDLFTSILKADMPNGSPEAALALGVHLNKEVVQTLIATLRDCTQGWTRFCAYRALKNLSGEDHFCDWIFGSKSVRESRIADYESWLKELK